MDKVRALTTSQIQVAVKDDSATGRIAEDMEGRPLPGEEQSNPMRKLFRLAEESARVIAQLAAEAYAAAHEDLSPEIIDGFARMIQDEVIKTQKANPPLDERLPQESAGHFVHRVARDEAGNFLREQRERIAAMLRKAGGLTDHQIATTSAQTLVAMSGVTDRLPTESYPEYRSRWQAEWDDSKASGPSPVLVQRVAQDAIGPVLAAKRQILASALGSVGDLKQDEIRQMSAEALVSMEDAFAWKLHYEDFIVSETCKEWCFLLDYWQRLRREPEPVCLCDCHVTT